jgi:hypothetical protein
MSMTSFDDSTAVYKYLKYLDNLTIGHFFVLTNFEDISFDNFAFGNLDFDKKT